MTTEEKRKYRWLKPLAYIASWGIQYPIQVTLAILLLVPALICEHLRKLLEAVYDFLDYWIVRAPATYIFNRLGFFKLHKKAQQWERYKKAMQQD